MINRLVVLLGIVIISFSCAKSHDISEDELDLKVWKNDPNGCKGDREKLEDDFIAVKDRLIGTSITDIRRTLGKPDHVDLDKRSTKQYVYYVTPGSQCEGKAGDDGKSYKVFFDALELVKEITPVL